MEVVSWVLLACFGLAYALAYLKGGWDEERTRYSHRTLLRLTSLVLVLLSWWAVFQQSGGSLFTFALCVAGGMFITFMGDLVTGGIIPTSKPYVVATAVFGAGHICYLGAIFLASRALNLSISPEWMALGLVVGAAIGISLARGGKASLRGPAIAYAILLGGMMGSALGLGWQRPEWWSLSLGSVLFSVSDTLLGHRELRKARWFMMYDVVWAFYILGQLGIVWSAVTGAV